MITDDGVSLRTVLKEISAQLSMVDGKLYTCPYCQLSLPFAAFFEHVHLYHSQEHALAGHACFCGEKRMRNYAIHMYEVHQGEYLLSKNPGKDVVCERIHRQPVSTLVIVRLIPFESTPTPINLRRFVIPSRNASWLYAQRDKRAGNCPAEGLLLAKDSKVRQFDKLRIKQEWTLN